MARKIFIIITVMCPNISLNSLFHNFVAGWQILAQIGKCYLPKSFEKDYFRLKSFAWSVSKSWQPCGDDKTVVVVVIMFTPSPSSFFQAVSLQKMLICGRRLNCDPLGSLNPIYFNNTGVNLIKEKKISLIKTELVLSS